MKKTKTKERETFEIEHFPSVSYEHLGCGLQPDVSRTQNAASFEVAFVCVSLLSPKYAASVA